MLNFTTEHRVRSHTLRDVNTQICRRSVLVCMGTEAVEKKAQRVKIAGQKSISPVDPYLSIPSEGHHRHISTREERKESQHSFLSCQAPEERRQMGRDGSVVLYRNATSISDMFT